VLDSTGILRPDGEDVSPAEIFDPAVNVNGDLVPGFFDIHYWGRIWEDCVD
jgi:hypothetical protein